MTGRNTEMEVVQLPKELVDLDAAYQRPIRPHIVNRIMNHFNPILFRPLTISKRDGRYIAVDGKTRGYIAKQRDDIRTVPCIIHEGLSEAEEAEIFVDLNSDAKKPGRSVVFNARVIMGDQTAIFIKQQLELAGLELVASVKKPGQIGAIEKTEFILKQTGQENFLAVLKMCAELCNTVPVSRKLLSGIAGLKSFDIDITDPKIQKRILKIGFYRINESITMATMQLGNAGNKACATGIARLI